MTCVGRNGFLGDEGHVVLVAPGAGLQAYLGCEPLEGPASTQAIGSPTLLN